jgi:predicted nucleotidyltransferase
LEIKDIASNYNLRLLIVFGSYGTKRYTKDSDIDLGYLSEAPLQPEEEINLLRDLIFCFKKDRIDLVNLDKANPLLLYEAASQGRVLYGSEEDFLRFKIKAFARYTETKFLREKRREYLLNLP